MVEVLCEHGVVLIDLFDVNSSSADSSLDSILRRFLGTWNLILSHECVHARFKITFFFADKIASSLLSDPT